MGGLAAAPAGWAGAGLLGGASLGEGAAAVGTFLVSNPVGWAILGAGALYVGYEVYQAAHSQSQAKFQQQTITNACSTCHNCNDLQNEIQAQRDELKQRYGDMRADQHGLYQAGPGGIPGKPYLGTWAGHQQQFENKQSRLQKLLNAANTANCPTPNGDFWQWATQDPPSKPAP